MQEHRSHFEQAGRLTRYWRGYKYVRRRTKYDVRDRDKGFSLNTLVLVLSAWHIRLTRIGSPESFLTIRRYGISCLFQALDVITIVIVFLSQSQTETAPAA